VLGNFTSVTTGSNTQTETFNQQNEITGISGAGTVTYDANGNLTADGSGNTYVYDAWNQLVKVNNGGTMIAAYSYDGLGRRISETHGTTTTDLYLSSAGQVLEERVGGQVQARNVWSPVYVNALVLRDQSSQHNGVLDQRLYVQQDANWNVTALVDTSGNVVERYDYTPYGAVTVLNPDFSVRSTSTYNVPYGFQGMRSDGLVSLNFADNRVYDPALQRWLQTDPIGLNAGNNDYEFGGNGPTDSVDPSGLEEDKGFFWGAFATWTEYATLGIPSTISRAIETKNPLYLTNYPFSGIAEGVATDYEGWRKRGNGVVGSAYLAIEQNKPGNALTVGIPEMILGKSIRGRDHGRILTREDFGSRTFSAGYELGSIGALSLEARLIGKTPCPSGGTRVPVRPIQVEINPRTLERAERLSARLAPEEAPAIVGRVPQGARRIRTDPNGHWVAYENADGTREIVFDVSHATNAGPKPLPPRGPGKPVSPQTAAMIGPDGKVLVTEGMHRLEAAQGGAIIAEADGGIPGQPGWLRYTFVERPPR
jgi:RHS repeat-associated protein